MLALQRRAGIARQRLGALGQGASDELLGMLRQAERLADEKKWSEAKPMLEKLVQLYPDFTGARQPVPHPGRRPTANWGRPMPNDRSDQLRAEGRPGAGCLPAADGAGDTGQEIGPPCITNAHRYLAVNPLVPPPYRFLARASEATGRTAVPRSKPTGRLLQLDPPNPAEVHFQLASCCTETASRGAPACPAGAGGGTALPRSAALAAPDAPGSLQRSCAQTTGTFAVTMMQRACVTILLFCCAPGCRGAGPGPMALAGPRAASRRHERHAKPSNTPGRHPSGPTPRASSTTCSPSSASAATKRLGSGGPWWTDAPDSDLNLSYRLQQMTALKVNPERAFSPADR